MVSVGGLYTPYGLTVANKRESTIQLIIEDDFVPLNVLEAKTIFITNADQSIRFERMNKSLGSDRENRGPKKNFFFVKHRQKIKFNLYEKDAPSANQC